MMSQFIATILLVILAPFLILLFILMKVSQKDSFLFLQQRLGKDKQPFTIYKIRTMIPEAEKLKKKYLHLNEAQLPAFKIIDDPRYTKIGKLLSHTGLDEIPQLINILKGDMAFVGPRPLPVEEAKKVPQKYQRRFEVLPGITSLWVVKGTHKLSFEEWMELDMKYVKEKNAVMDFKIAFLTMIMICKQMIRNIHFIF